jgi:protein dithiol oxidoreductase (disulfide-forming)
MTRYALALLAALLATACNAEPPTAPPEAQPASQAQPDVRPVERAPAAEAEAEQVRVAQAQPQQAQANARFVAGQHYRVLNPAQPTSVPPGKVEVAEIFWYGCPHCYTLEPYIQRWQANKPEAAELVKLPAALNPSWAPHARLFYAAQGLGILEQAHGDIFREMHVNRNPLNSLDAMVDFLARYEEVSAEAAREALTSFAVETELRRADAQVRRYRLDGVPAVVVNGKYVASASSAGGYDELLQLINHLVALEAGVRAN